MDPVAIVSQIQTIIAVAELARKLGQDLAPFVEMSYQVIFKQQPLTPEQRNDLLRRENDLRARLNARELPPEEEPGNVMATSP